MPHDNVARRHRPALRVERDARDARRARRHHRDGEVVQRLSDGEREALRFADARRARIVRWRVTCPVVAFDDARKIAHRRRQIVLARRNADDPELAEVVCRRDPAGVHQLRPALNVARLHQRQLHVFGRLAQLVDHASGEDGAARQREVDLFNCLAVEELNGFARLVRPPLPVRQVDVAALRHADGVAAGCQVFEFVLAAAVGGCRAVLRAGRAENARDDPHLRLAQWLTGISRDDVTAKSRRALSGIRVVAGRRGGTG